MLHAFYSLTINSYEYRPVPQFSTKIAFDPCLNLLEFLCLYIYISKHFASFVIRKLQ